MPTLKIIPNSYLTPNAARPASEVYDYAIGNPDAMRRRTYGDRDVVGAAPPHNHGEDGGLILSGQHIAALSFGPYNKEGSGSALNPGIYLRETNLAETMQGFGNTKKIASCLVLLPGGVKEVTVRIYYFLATFGDNSTFEVTFRALDNISYKYSFSPSEVRNFGPGGPSPAGFNVFDMSFPDLSPIGSCLSDRVVELAIWQSYNVGAGKNCAVLACLVFPSPESLNNSSTRGRNKADLSLYEVETADILPNSGGLSPGLGTKIKGRYNQEIAALLGRAPGVQENMLSPDRARDYRQNVEDSHRHQGILVPDLLGGYFSDGAVIRYPPKVAKCWARNLGEGAGLTVSNDPIQGVKLHPNGLLDGQWARFTFKVFLEGGLGTLSLHLSLQTPTTDPKTRGRIHLGAFPLGWGTDAGIPGAGAGNVIKGVKSGKARATTTDAAGLLVCEFEPLDSVESIRGRDRKAAGLGSWTADAILPAAAQLPNVDLRNVARVSVPITAELSHPGIRPEDTGRASGWYMLVVRIEVSQETLGGYDPDARILSLLVVSGKGW